MLETKANRDKLQSLLFINYQDACITTLFHCIVCLINKDFSIIIDMLRYQRRRQFPAYVTFEDIQKSSAYRSGAVYIPGTIEFVVELALWAQQPDILEQFARNLNEQIQDTPTDFMKHARDWDSTKKDKHVKYLKKILRYYQKNEP